MCIDVGILRDTYVDVCGLIIFWKQVFEITYYIKMAFYFKIFLSKYAKFACVTNTLEWERELNLCQTIERNPPQREYKISTFKSLNNGLQQKWITKKQNLEQHIFFSTS